MSKEKRILVIGDIHGNYKGLMQVLERSNFDYEEDTLISIGDVVDGHSQSYEVVEELLKIKNLIAIKGNHDDWFNTWIKTGKNLTDWGQGQKATGLSYLHNIYPDSEWLSFNHELSGMEPRIKPHHIPEKHKEFFKNQLKFYEDENDNLFVHGGFDLYTPIEIQGNDLWWNRSMWEYVCKGGSIKKSCQYKEVFIGHTSTEFIGKTIPVNKDIVWNVDTGGGWFGKISIMDINTKEFWQSDTGKELYPGFKGR